jgi:prophage DNA circulation protein
MARDWVRTLRAANFRGVAFHVEADTHDGGKRLGLHEYAGGYSTLVEEMGATTERFSVTAYLTSDTADMQAAAIRAACMAPGAGLLRLPTEAARMVYVEDFSRLRERDRMGYIAFGFTAVPMGGVGVAALGLGDVTVSFQADFGPASVSFAVMF